MVEGGGGVDYDRKTILTQKGRSPHNLDGLLYRLVGGIIQETLRYKSDIGSMARGDTLPRSLMLGESEHPTVPFGFYRGESFPLALATAQ